MSLYIIGDVQGCFDELQALLKKINFNPEKDRLGFVGDLVNRGPKSLETLRFIKNLTNPIVVLGNHDLHLLVSGYGYSGERAGVRGSINPILEAPDKKELLDWLRQQPLAYFDATLNFCLVHAGIPPQWGIAETLQYAKEVSDILKGPNFLELLKTMYGDQPEDWSLQLKSQDRDRYIINALTRMRFCDHNGKLDLKNTGPKSRDPNFKPWFEWRTLDRTIIFGHWAALEGKCTIPNYYALDTGCVWGNSLTALRVEDKKLFSVNCNFFFL